MFFGKALYTLDNKARLTIPARYRDLLAPSLVVTRHPTEECLMILPIAEWERFSSRLRELSMVDPKAALLRRKVFSNAEITKADAQGRILIDESLRQHARVTDKALIVGVDTHLELWNPELWDDQVAPQFDDVELNRQIFAALGI